MEQATLLTKQEPHMGKSTRFYITDGLVPWAIHGEVIVDGRDWKVVATSNELDADECLIEYIPPQEIGAKCFKLNELDYAMNRQYGESRTDFAARTGV